MKKYLSYYIYNFIGNLLDRTNIYSINPIFIIGTGRCGSGLLTTVLKTFDKVSVFHGEGNSLWYPKTYPFSERTLDTVPIIKDPYEFTISSIAHWPKNHEEKIRNILLGYFYLKNSQIKIIKSAMISFLIPKLLDIFPNAKFIHLYRFGPAVVKSLYKKEKTKYNNLFNGKHDFMVNCAKYWNDCILEIEKRKNEYSLEHKSKFIEIKYEDLCETPENVIQNIARFLGIENGNYQYDTSKIFSRNYKVAKYINSEKWEKIILAMEEGLNLKGYLQ